MSLVTPDTGLLFWMVIIFGVVFFILAKFGFPVITDMVRKRTDSINQSLKLAEEARTELAQLSQDQAELIAQAKREQARILDDANKLKASIIAQAKEQAKVEADKVLEQARVEIAAEKESALRDIRKEVALLSMSVAEKVMRDRFDSQDVQSQYLDKVISEISKSDMSSLN